MSGRYILNRGHMRCGQEKGQENDGERGGKDFCCYSRTYPLYRLCSRGNIHIIIMTSHSVTYLLMRFIFRLHFCYSNQLFTLFAHFIQKNNKLINNLLEVLTWVVMILAFYLERYSEIHFTNNLLAHVNIPSKLCLP